MESENSGKLFSSFLFLLSFLLHLDKVTDKIYPGLLIIFGFGNFSVHRNSQLLVSEK